VYEMLTGQSANQSLKRLSSLSPQP
jgi:hypothetical protein